MKTQTRYHAQTVKTNTSSMPEIVIGWCFFVLLSSKLPLISFTSFVCLHPLPSPKCPVIFWDYSNSFLAVLPNLLFFSLRECLIKQKKANRYKANGENFGCNWNWWMVFWEGSKDECDGTAPAFEQLSTSQSQSHIVTPRKPVSPLSQGIKGHSATWCTLETSYFIAKPTL